MEFIQTDAKGTSKKYFLVFIIIYVFILYANTLSHGFVLDDVAVIEQNKFVQLGLSGFDEIMSTFYWNGYWNDNAGLYRPLSLITFALEFQMNPNNPSIHHFFSIFYYSICCVLLFQVLIAIFNKINPWFIFLLVGVFVSHPIHTEVVANIKSRDEILSLLFVLLTIKLFYFSTFEKKNKLILTSLTYFLALLSKEGALVLLPCILIYEWTKFKNIKQIFKNTWHIGLTFVVWIGIHSLVISQGGKVDAYDYNDNSLVLGTFWEQKSTSLALLLDYIGQLFFPISFSYDYSFKQIELESPFSLKTIFAFLIILLCTVLLIKNLYKSKIFVAGIVIFFFSIALTSNIFFLIGATYAERFLFVSVIAEILFFLSLFVWMHSKKFNPTIFVAILLLINLIYSFKTIQRNKDWESNFTLFESAISSSPNSARVQYNYGTILLTEKGSNRSSINQAIFSLEKCLSLDSNYTDAAINLSNAYIKNENYPKAKSSLLKALRKKGNDATLLGSLGEVEFRLNDFNNALIHLEQAQVLGNNINLINNYIGTIYFNKQDLTKAILYYEKGVKNDPSNLNLILNLANALAANQQFSKAFFYFKDYQSKNPSNTQVNQIVKNFENNGINPTNE